MMNVSNGNSTSVWMATASVPDFPPLQGAIDVEICVIGAGIAGLTCAYLLAKAGKRVVLIDALGIGAGETGRTTAHFFPPDEWYGGLEAAFGKDTTLRIAEGFALVTDLVESIIEREGIDCEFERLDGFLYALPDYNADEIGKEYDAAQRAGVDVELLPQVPDLSFETGPCVRYRNLAQFHPLKYLAGLARAFLAHGGTIHCHTRALEIEGDGETQRVTIENGVISAAHVVVCTNTPFNDRVVMHTKQAAYRSYVVGVRVPKGSVPRILLWDTGDPYYYVRLETPDPAAAHEILVVGGADRKVGQDSQPEQRHAEIERWVRARFPMAGPTEFRWSGQIMEPADGLAFLGRNPLDDRNVYVITGDSGNGMTHCTLGALLVQDLILGHDNPWLAIYDPARKATHGEAISEFASEQANTLAQYTDWLTPGDVASVHDIAPGDAAIVRDGARKLAVFRDAQGQLHGVSARCTHLGCVVHWNAAERSWDCPCHGSRFDVHGNVLHGPASTPLEAIAIAPGGAVPEGGK